MKRLFVWIPLLLLLFFSGSCAIPSVNPNQNRPVTYLSALVPHNVLSWIEGNACATGLDAYLHTAGAYPAVALVGPGWLDPQTGLILSASNTCAPRYPSMNNLVRVVHQHSGKAYLAITIDSAWSSTLQAEYITRAASGTIPLDPIVRTAEQWQDDGVILDIESVDGSTPDIAASFTHLADRLATRLHLAHKTLGVALIHKTGDQDPFRSLNGFQQWGPLGMVADFLIIMALDEYVASPGPPTTLSWLESIERYALRSFSHEALSHIVWELPLYGSLWSFSEYLWQPQGQRSYQAALTDETQSGHDFVQVNNGATNVRFYDSFGMLYSEWFFSPEQLVSLLTQFRAFLSQAEPNQSFAISFWVRTEQEPDIWGKLSNLLRLSPLHSRNRTDRSTFLGQTKEDRH